MTHSLTAEALITDILPMLFRLTIVARCAFAGRFLEIGDVVDLNLATGECFTAAALPFNVGAILGLLADGSANPVEASVGAVRRGLTGRASEASTSPPAPRLRLLKG